MAFFLAAYAVAWGLIFGYVVWMYRRQARIERELELLRELMAQQKEP